MNNALKYVLVGSSMACLLWAGCTDDEPNEDPATVSSSTSDTASASVTVTGSATVTTATSTGAGATGPGCDDVPGAAPSNGMCVPFTGGVGVGGSGGGTGGTGGTGGNATGGTGGTGGSGGSTASVVTVGVGGAGGGPAAVYQCNPVTNDGCGPSDACDLNQNGEFVCFGPPNNAMICEFCDNGNGPFCAGTMTCISGEALCRRYCCDNSDCGPSLTCQKGLMVGNDEVGLCLP